MSVTRGKTLQNTLIVFIAETNTETKESKNGLYWLTAFFKTCSDFSKHEASQGKWPKSKCAF